MASQPAFFIIRPDERRTVQGKFAGTRREIICDEATPTDNLVTGVVHVIQRGGKVPLHHHPIEEFQFIVSGQAIARDAQGNEYPIQAGTAIYCRPGPEGAHEYENVGPEPLAILFVFPNQGGIFPEILEGKG
ncbi:MAG TPA: cupin domain-containing protein [Anaerolineae bacterium]|nr:cupin domain-containing protein [Anaerolineae bacterium]